MTEAKAETKSAALKPREGRPPQGHRLESLGEDAVVAEGISLVREAIQIVCARTGAVVEAGGMERLVRDLRDVFVFAREGRLGLVKSDFLNYRNQVTFLRLTFGDLSIDLDETKVEVVFRAATARVCLGLRGDVHGEDLAALASVSHSYVRNLFLTEDLVRAQRGAGMVTAKSAREWLVRRGVVL